jgi:hypothetical protein
MKKIRHLYKKLNKMTENRNSFTRTERKAAQLATSPKMKTTMTTWTTRNAPQSTPSVCKEADLRTIVQVNLLVKINSLVQPILAKVNNSNRFHANAGFAKFKVTIKKTAGNARPPRSQWLTQTANHTPTRLLPWLSPNNRTTTPAPPPSHRSHLILII